MIRQRQPQPADLNLELDLALEGKVISADSLFEIDPELAAKLAKERGGDNTSPFKLSDIPLEKLAQMIKNGDIKLDSKLVGLIDEALKNVDIEPDEVSDVEIFNQSDNFMDEGDQAMPGTSPGLPSRPSRKTSKRSSRPADDDDLQESEEAEVVDPGRPPRSRAHSKRLSQDS